MSDSDADRLQYIANYARQPGVTPEEPIGVTRAFAQSQQQESPTMHAAEAAMMRHSTKMPPHWVVEVAFGDVIGCAGIIHETPDPDWSGRHEVILRGVLYGATTHEVTVSGGDVRSITPSTLADRRDLR